MKQSRLGILGIVLLGGACVFVGVQTASAQVKPAVGKITGVVNDTTGVPQLGATVEVMAESSPASPLDFLTNTQGVFRGDKLVPGFYTVRVTLAGFLPTIEQHVRISAHLTTVVRVELESMFASLDQLRRAPSANTVEADDWKWVLRSAPLARPVLQWMDSGDDSTSAANVSSDIHAVRPRALLAFTDGARQPGSTSNVPATPATSFAYDQKLGGAGRLLVAGQMNYLDSIPGGGVATVWLPNGSLDNGFHSALVLREAKLGPTGQTFRGVRLEQGGSFGLGDRGKLMYSGEYVLVGLDRAASSIRPRVELDERLSDDWHAALIFAEEPGAGAMLSVSDEDEPNCSLAAAMNELDSFPSLLLRAGRPELEGGWHEEIAAERKMGTGGQLQIAAFHDDDSHVAVYGHGGAGLPSAEYLQEYFSNAFAYDGGSLNSWGGRAVLREKLSDDLAFAAMYEFAGALSPTGAPEGPLRDMLRASMHHSVGASVSAKIPRSRTKLNAGYTWVSGVAITRLDPFGESLYQMDPYLHVGIRQALPKFGPGHWQAVADIDNILAQGYVSLNTADGRTVLVPSFRTFRGGLSVQF